MGKLKVVWEIRRENNDGHYIEDNPEADYPNEVYVTPSWSRQIIVKEIEGKDLQKAFNDEDGDADFSNSILYVLDSNDKVLFYLRKEMSREQFQDIKERLIAQYKEVDDNE